MAFEQDQNTLLKAPALAGAFRAVRGELHGGDASLDETDISQTLHGAKAVTGRAVWSANNAARIAQSDTEKREENEKEQDAREMRELAHLAAWNAQMTMVGGVPMTNAEAQEARQHIIDHADEYADKAAHEGRIGVDEKEELFGKFPKIYRSFLALA